MFLNPFFACVGKKRFLAGVGSAARDFLRIAGSVFFGFVRYSIYCGYYILIKGTETV
jgi:hypothetical protein